jgi:hypothetical protein
MQAKIKRNLQLLSYFTLIIRLDFNIVLIIILFNKRLNPIKNPFLLKLYMFSAIILYFLIAIIS